MPRRTAITSAQAFGIAVKRSRMKRRMTQELLAHEAGLSLTSIARMETGAHGVRLDTVLRVASALDVTASDLVAECERILKR